MGRTVLWVLLVGALLVGAPNAWGILTDEGPPLEAAGPVVDPATAAAETLAPPEVASAAEPATAGLDEALPSADEPLDAAPETVAGAPVVVGDTVPGVDQATQDAIETVREVFACRMAVRVTLSGYEGTVSDSRSMDVLYIATRDVEVTVQAFIQSAEATAALQEYGLDVPEEKLVLPIELSVKASWLEEYVTWEESETTFYLGLPLGLTYLGLADVAPELVEDCDGSLRILWSEPTAQDAGYDYWVLAPAGRPRDGWYVHVFNVDVGLAQGTLDRDLPSETIAGFAFYPAEVRTAIDREIAETLAALDPVLRELGAQQLLEKIQDDPASVLEDVESLVDSAGQLLTALPAVLPVPPLAECRTAVQITHVSYGGHADEHRDWSIRFSTPRVIPWTLIQHVPTYVVDGREVAPEFVTESTPAGGFVDYEETIEQTQKLTDIAVEVSWMMEYVWWEEVRQTYYVTLPVGLPFVLADAGLITEVCDPDAAILDTPDSPDRSQYDYWIEIGELGRPADGWIVHILAAQVRIALGQEVEEWPDEFWSGYTIAPGEVHETVEGLIAELEGVLESWTHMEIPALLPTLAPQPCGGEGGSADETTHEELLSSLPDVPASAGDAEELAGLAADQAIPLFEALEGAAAPVEVPVLLEAEDSDTAAASTDDAETECQDVVEAAAPLDPIIPTMEPESIATASAAPGTNAAVMTWAMVLTLALSSGVSGYRTWNRLRK